MELAATFAIALVISSGTNPVFAHDRVAAETIAIDSGNPLVSLFASLATLIPFGALPARIDLLLAVPMLLAAFWLSQNAGDRLAYRLGALFWAASSLTGVAPKDALALAAFSYALTRASDSFAAASLWAMSAFCSPVLTLFLLAMHAIGPRVRTGGEVEATTRSPYSFWGALAVVAMVVVFWIARRREHVWVLDSWVTVLFAFPSAPASTSQILMHATIVVLSVVAAIATKRASARLPATVILALASWALRQPSWLFLASALAAPDVAFGLSHAAIRSRITVASDQKWTLRHALRAIVLSAWIALSFAAFERQIAPESARATAGYLRLSELALAPPNALLATESHLQLRASAVAEFGVRPDVSTLPIGPYLRQDCRAVAERMSAEDPRVELLLRALILNGKIDALTLSTFSEHTALITDLAPRAWNDVAGNALQTPFGLEIRGERVAPSERKLSPNALLIGADAELCAATPIAECADFASQRATFDAMWEHRPEALKPPAAPASAHK
jgi:hypothetical protein